MGAFNHENTKVPSIFSISDFATYDAKFVVLQYRQYISGPYGLFSCKFFEIAEALIFLTPLRLYS